MQLRKSKAAYARAFQHHVLTNLRLAEAQCHYDLSALRIMIDERGAVTMARMLVDPSETDNPPGGFLVLFSFGLERYTIEQAMVDFAHTGLFDDYEIEAAKRRLAKFSVLSRLERQHG